MKKLRFFLLSFLSQCLVTTAFAQADSAEFVTPKDVLRGTTTSNINVQNNRGTPVTVYGLYVRQFAYVSPGQTCAQAQPMYSAAQNTTAGAFVMPTAINAGKSAAVGANYLYNMLYQAIYYVNIIASPPVCFLPGCTWPTDITAYNWCIYLGALAPVNNSPSFTANVPPNTETASGGGYNYNLVSNFTYLGPISCNDQALTCSVVNQQTQTFS